MALQGLKLPKLAVNYSKLIRQIHQTKQKANLDEHHVLRQIQQKIKVRGPLTVAEYMREVLTNPAAGYYMHKDMLGDMGDFITSPEITQMFGEMIAVWFINEWQKMGSPKPFQLVELGPGRGTLCNDILKVFSHFKVLHKVNLQLVEISPALSDMQAKLLCSHSFNSNLDDMAYKKGITHHGIPVQWFKQISDVPNCFTLFLAHEFFDALPIHKFHRTYSGYREVLIDLEPSTVNSKEPRFRYVLSRNKTPMMNALLIENETREHVEVCPDAIPIYKEICQRVKSFGGIALICDYGHNGDGTDTFRAFKKHKQVDPLIMPGTADLTADVDFQLIRKVADEEQGILTLGPVMQRDFLLKTGLEYRFKSLTRNLTDEKSLENLTECYKALTDRDKMGERFKFCALFPETMKKILNKCPVVGFT